MTARTRWIGIVLVLGLMGLDVNQPAKAQDRAGATTVAFGVGASRATAQALDGRIAQMLASGDLVRHFSEADPLGGGRVHEYFVQRHDGVTVYGGGVSRQQVGGETVSAFGTIYEGITVSVRPRLTSAVALAGPADAPLAALAPGADVEMFILPELDGQYRLVYRSTFADGQVRFIDAESGVVARSEDAFVTQGVVGQGTGVHSDAKKLSTSPGGAGFEARDVLRPASITTRSTQGTSVTQNQLLQGAGATASDSDNVWTNPAVVDAHVNAGWMNDYLFKRHGWNGVDGLNSAHQQVVADFATLPDNAFFAYPVSSTSGTGLAAYGVSSRGVPMTPLDIVGHEMMHGVTFFSLRRRTGGNLSNAILNDGLGPTTAISGTLSLPCTNAQVTFSDGVVAPFLCQNGQYILVSNHGGALHEGFSDIFGTAAEFFYEAPGNAALRADYLMGEDTAIGGPAGTPVTGLIRSLSTPAAIPIVTGLSYPDHYDQRIRYTVVNRLGVGIVVNFTIINGRFVAVPVDGGGVHFNATVIGHAYYLAIEGGTNRVSGRAVTGVGQANREQIERVFFRAMTVLTPQATTYPIMAVAVRQAAVDLYGSASAAFRAVDQALAAVGL
jgi:Zn-dependent metalloprotease